MGYIILFESKLKFFYNSSWDEWVPDSRILKHNEENIKKQKDLIEEKK